MKTKDRFLSYETDFEKFYKIPEEERLNVNPVLCGILKIQSLMKNPENIFLTSEICGELQVNIANDLKEELSDEDIHYLVKCGVCYSSINDCYILFI